jgi:hypothetical protein
MNQEKTSLEVRKIMSEESPFDSEGNIICTRCKAKLLDLEIFGNMEHVCNDDSA